MIFFLRSAHYKKTTILCAFQNRAEVLYIPPAGVDLQNLEFPDLPNEHHSRWLTASVLAKSAKFSSHHHFGCNMSLVNERSSEENAAEYKLLQRRTPVMYASADIRIQTRWAKDFSGDNVELKTCDETAPSVVLEQRTYGEIRMDGVKVHYLAAWSLSSCSTSWSNAKDCAAWSVVVQNLLWKAGHTVMLYYNKVTPSSSSGTSLKSFPLQQFLKKWSCPMESMMACGINLIDQLSQSGYLSQEFASKQIAWFKALNAVGFHYPQVTKTAAVRNLSSDTVTFNAVNFSDNLPWLKGRKHPFSPVANTKTTHLFYDGLCESANLNVPSSINVNFSSPWMQLDDILLIVVFNSPYYDNIRYIETMYRTVFPRILYCGPFPLDHKEFPWAKEYTLSFVMFDNDLNHTAGAFSYDCMIRAISMNYHVSGYLVMADDMLMLPQSLSSYNKHSMWFIPPDLVRIGEITKLRECRLGMCDFHPHWHWWEDYQQATIDALNDLKKIQYSDTFYKCYQQLVMLNGAELRPNGAYSDMYYVPARLQQQVLELFEHFLKHRVFVEIAVPTVINCLVGTSNVEKLPGKSVWDESRDMPWLYFTNKDLMGKKYLHPTKWSYIKSGSTEMRDFFCRNVIPYLFDPYERIERNKRQ